MPEMQETRVKITSRLNIITNYSSRPRFIDAKYRQQTNISCAMHGGLIFAVHWTEVVSGYGLRIIRHMAAIGDRLSRFDDF